MARRINGGGGCSKVGIGAILLVLLLLASCASNRLLSSQVQPAAAGKKVEDVLIVGVFHDQLVRKLYEKSFARGLSGVGVTSFLGHVALPEKEPINRDTVIKAVELTGAKSVLVTRLTEIRSTTSTKDAVGRTYDSLDDAPFAPGMHYAMSSLSTSSATTVKVQLEALLYDVKSRQLLWSAAAEVVDPVLTNRYIDTVTVLYIEDLKKNNLL